MKVDPLKDNIAAVDIGKKERRTEKKEDGAFLLNLPYSQS